MASRSAILRASRSATAARLNGASPAVAGAFRARSRLGATQTACRWSGSEEFFETPPMPQPEDLVILDNSTASRATTLASKGKPGSEDTPEALLSAAARARRDAAVLPLQMPVNPFFGEQPLHTELRKVPMPQSVRSPFDGPREAWVHDLWTGKRTSLTRLSPDVFGAPRRPDLINEAARWAELCKYPVTRYQLDRAEMYGGGRKPRPQKGTGQARQGSIRVPHYINGAKAHAVKPRDRGYEVPEGWHAKSMRVALSQKLREDNLLVVEHLDRDFTRDELEARMGALGVAKCVLVDAEFDKDVDAMLNTNKISPWYYVSAADLNCLPLLRFGKLVLTEAAVTALEGMYCRRELAVQWNEQAERNRRFQDLWVPDAFSELPHPAIPLHAGVPPQLDATIPTYYQDDDVQRARDYVESGKPLEA